ncbi:putative protein of unknown function (DUF1963) [Blattamonas nauphoetae]|uniref:DUF1963 domain-containing protein n=1 Tax=Blattamonas nauphoetae TaxID=2049346 RepID=A0ABQ9WLD3_9EUKA|nr:putative protein of unknown function (DUF1963) [Blattamonas nauphoetae]
MDFPLSADGEMLTLLAQLNFAELPHLPHFPSEGILQFFCLDDDFTGVDYDNPTQQSKFRVFPFTTLSSIGRPSSTDGRADLSIYWPFRKQEYRLTGTLRDSLPNILHFQFQLILDAFVENCADAGQNFTSDDVDAMVDDYCVYIASKRCHTIGGYTNFVEADPRMYNSKFEPYTVNLLQIGSVGDIYVSECGIASFLIKPDKLDAKDFTDVLYIIDSS